MSLVHETGAGLSDAESFISVADADNYLAARGYALWGSDMATAEKEQALRRATGFMEQLFRGRWKGTKLLRAQALSWPRYGAMADGWDVDTTIVPTDVANACAELAYKAASGDLNPDLTRGIVRERLGPIETEFDRYGSQATRYRSVEMMLAPYLKVGSLNAMLVRA